jgi:hypothetical protein
MEETTPIRKWKYNIKMDRKAVECEWTELIWHRIESAGGICGHSDEPSVSMEGGKFLDHLNDC